MPIDYTHSRNLHTQKGPRTALPALFGPHMPSSLLDVGCGLGTWLRAAIDMGITDYQGLDGVPIPGSTLLFPKEHFFCQDLTQAWNLGRKFDVALCLEVAEHLDEAHAETLVSSLTKHSDKIIFSAACPDQPGQHHVNCQWPVYWQQLFNRHGFACSDDVRWLIWTHGDIEPWYRQNIFVAIRDANLAGHEKRIPSVIHPAMLPMIKSNQKLKEHTFAIEHGRMPVGWYVTTPLQAAVAKLKRKLMYDRVPISHQ